MARDDDDQEERVRRRREREDEIEQEDAAKRRKMGVESTHAPLEKLEDLLGRIEPMIDQIDNLYGQFLRGFEKQPPLARRKLLDQMMATVSLMPKNTAGLQFRFVSLNGSYISHRDKWDKLMRDLESGKIKRTIPGRPGPGGRPS